MFGRKERQPAEKPMTILRGEAFTQLSGRTNTGWNQATDEAAAAPVPATIEKWAAYYGAPTQHSDLT